MFMEVLKANILGHSKCIKGKRLMSVPDGAHWVLRSNRRFLENVPTGEAAQGRAVPVAPVSGGSSFLPAAGRSRGNGTAVTQHVPPGQRTQSCPVSAPTQGLWGLLLIPKGSIRNFVLRL